MFFSLFCSFSRILLSTTQILTLQCIQNVAKAFRFDIIKNPGFAWASKHFDVIFSLCSSTDFWRENIKKHQEFYRYATIHCISEVKGQGRSLIRRRATLDGTNDGNTRLGREGISSWHKSRFPLDYL